MYCLLLVYLHPRCTSDDSVSTHSFHRDYPANVKNLVLQVQMDWQDAKVSHMNVDHIELQVQQNQFDQPDVMKVVEIVENVEHRKMGEQQECQEKLEQKALPESRAHKVHVVSMDNSDPLVCKKESCICCICCSCMINTQQARPYNLLKGYRQNR